MATVARSLIRLHHGVNNRDRKLAFDLATKAFSLPGMTHFSRATVMAPDFHKDNKTHVPMRVATDKQAARGKWQTVYVMHRNQHIESYEIFTEEKDGDVGEGKGEEGKLEEGEVEEEIKMK